MRGSIVLSVVESFLQGRWATRLADDYSEPSDYYVLSVAVCFNSFLFMTFANQNYITFSVQHTLPFRSRFNNSNNII